MSGLIEVASRDLSQALRGIAKILRTATAPVKIRTNNLQNTSLERHHYINLACSVLIF